MNASPQSEVEIERLVTWLIATFETQHDITLDNEAAIKRIRADANHIHSRWLAHRSDSCSINLPFLAVSESGPVHLEKNFSPREIAAIFDGSAIAPSAAEGRARREESARDAREKATAKGAKREAERRRTMYFGIAVIAFLTIVLVGIFGFSHEHSAPERDHKKEMRH